jgi:hypothetical protein
MSAAAAGSHTKAPPALAKDQKSAAAAAAATAAAAASPLECGICCERFSGDIKSELHPRVLPKCGHSLCCGCVRKLVRSGKVWYAVAVADCCCGWLRLRILLSLLFGSLHCFLFHVEVVCWWCDLVVWFAVARSTASNRRLRMVWTRICRRTGF